MCVDVGRSVEVVSSFVVVCEGTVGCNDDDEEGDAFLKRCLKRWLRKGGVNTLFPAESLFRMIGLMPFWRIFLYGFFGQRNEHQSSISASHG